MECDGRGGCKGVWEDEEVGGRGNGGIPQAGLLGVYVSMREEEREGERKGERKGEEGGEEGERNIPQLVLYR